MALCVCGLYRIMRGARTAGGHCRGPCGGVLGSSGATWSCAVALAGASAGPGATAAFCAVSAGCCTGGRLRSRSDTDRAAQESSSVRYCLACMNITRNVTPEMSSMHMIAIKSDGLSPWLCWAMGLINLQSALHQQHALLLGLLWPGQCTPHLQQRPAAESAPGADGKGPGLPLATTALQGTWPTPAGLPCPHFCQRAPDEQRLGSAHTQLIVSDYLVRKPVPTRLVPAPVEACTSDETERCCWLAVGALPTSALIEAPHCSARCTRCDTSQPCSRMRCSQMCRASAFGCDPTCTRMPVIEWQMAYAPQRR